MRVSAGADSAVPGARGLVRLCRPAVRRQVSALNYIHAQVDGHLWQPLRGIAEGSEVREFEAIVHIA